MWSCAKFPSPISRSSAAGELRSFDVDSGYCVGCGGRLAEREGAGDGDCRDDCASRRNRRSRDRRLAPSNVWLVFDLFRKLAHILVASLLGMASMRGVTPARQRRMDNAYRQMFGPLRRPAFLAALLALFTSACASVALYYLLPFDLSSVQQIGPAFSDLIVLCVPLGMVPMGMVGGYLTDRYQARPVIPILMSLGGREMMSSASALSNLTARLGTVLGPLAMSIIWTLVSNITAQMIGGILLVDGFAIATLAFALFSPRKQLNDWGR